MDRAALPPRVGAVVAHLERVAGVVGVALGGSRAEGTADGKSDWDLGVYYRGPLDLARLAELGEVHPPGAWGRIMNGGAWLVVEGTRVDLVLRDIDVVRAWTERAMAGEYEVDLLLGSLAGIPTYTLAAESAIAKPLCGTVPPAVPFPDLLAQSAPERWRFHRRFTLEQARTRAARGDVVGTVGQAARAVIEEAHARLCARRVWVFNEKRIVQMAGLGPAQRLFEEPGTPLDEWVERVCTAIATGD